jgi:hypothetical protein
MDFLRVAVALITVFGLLGLLYFVSSREKARATLRSRCTQLMWPQKFRMVVNGTDADSLRVLRRVNLTGTHQLHLICTSHGVFLVCTHPQGCSLLRASDAVSVPKQDAAAQEQIERYAS